MLEPKIILGLLICILVVPDGALAQNEHVYRLTVKECRFGAGTRVLSGFRDRQSHGIVTALHGVAGCNSVVAVNATQTRRYDLTITKGVNIDHDLALLSSPELEQEAPAGLSAAGSVSSSVRVVGFPHAVPAAMTTTLALRTPSRVQLNDLLPSGQGTRAGVNTRLSPNPRATVLSVQGHLTLGHSGSPILDSSGRVVGVANGGLGNGALEISWAIPFTGSSSSWQSPASVSDELTRVKLLDPRVLFSFAEENADYPPVTCFGRTLDFVRTATLSDLVSTVDDPLTYQQLLHTYQLGNSRASFRIYRDVISAVTLVAPEEWMLAPSGSSCVASAPQGQGPADIRISYNLLEIDASTAFQQIDQRVLEAQVKTFFSNHFIVDPSTSNWGPRFALHRGVVARRVSFFQVDRFCGPFNMPLQQANAPRPPNYPKPFVQPNGYAACVNGVVYPDVWVAAGAVLPQDYITGAGFGSYMGSDRQVLIAQMQVRAANLGKNLAECTWALSRTDRCMKAFEGQRRFALGAVAATASTIAVEEP